MPYSFVTWATSQAKIGIIKYSTGFERCELPHFATFVMGKIELINENVKNLLNLSAS